MHSSQGRDWNPGNCTLAESPVSRACNTDIAIQSRRAFQERRPRSKGPINAAGGKTLIVASQYWFPRMPLVDSTRCLQAVLWREPVGMGSAPDGAQIAPLCNLLLADAPGCVWQAAQHVSVKLLCVHTLHLEDCLHVHDSMSPAALQAGTWVKAGASIPMPPLFQTVQIYPVLEWQSEPQPSALSR